MSQYRAVVDVTGRFNDWDLELQKHRIPLLDTPGGAYRAEAEIEVAEDGKVWLYWDAKGHSAVDWTFAISLALIEASGELGAAVSWSDKGSMLPESEVRINGILLLSNMKAA